MNQWWLGFFVCYKGMGQEEYGTTWEIGNGDWGINGDLACLSHRISQTWKLTPAHRFF
jgi:hypothetical protein